MGCGVSTSKRRVRPANRDCHRPITSEQIGLNRPFYDQNGSIYRERRLSLVSEGSEDELRSTELLQGNLSMAREDNNKIVRIFISSNITDTVHERNALMERVYPKMKSYCAEMGLSFQVVDMRWGIHEDTDNEHTATQLLVKELRTCQKISVGTSFVVFLSEKYGNRRLPRTIHADQFELIQSGIKDSDTKKLLQKWYYLDKNCIPHTYILQPISKNLPGFLSEDSSVVNQCKNTWWTEHETLQAALAKSARNSLSDSSEALKYTHSEIENEIRLGILEAENPDAHSLWFHRHIPDIHDRKPDKLLSRYTDCIGAEHLVREKKQLLENLKTSSLPKRIDKENIITYQVPWTQNGIDPANCRKHAEYIEQLCSDFEFHVKGQIKNALHAHEQSFCPDPLSDEVSRHSIFCQSKIEMFCGRQNIIDNLEAYLAGSSRYPYVVHGASGSGKTSIMAIAAQRAWELHSGKAIVILRFIGTSPDSSSVRTLLLSIVSQIRRLFQDDKPVPTDMKSLSDEFYTVLHLASAEQPIVLVFDSLDQFSSEYSARQLFWLPSKLPKHVKMLLSTLPEEKYECLPRLKMMLREDRHFLSVPRLNSHDVNSILSKWLEKQSRTLQRTQIDALVGAFSKCPLPLYLKVCFDEACRWHSYQDTVDAHLHKTIPDVINSLFQRIERSHGGKLVSRTLGYLTLSRNGLSEGELEDILSCDNEVLGEVFQHWTPPVRRLPPLLLIRIYSDLQPYLVERGADSTTVVSWYHRQFQDVAHQRYCSNRATRRQMHINIADYFRGTWSDKPKPFNNPHNGKEELALRYVARQPLMYETRYNLRKLMELPVHVMQAGLITVLKDEILCNLLWLTTKIQASSIRHVLDDCNMARLAFPDDEDLKNMAEVLQLSEGAAQMDPHQLPGQLLGRISQGNNKLMAQCCRPPYPALIPSDVILTQPGGQQIHTLSEHSDEVNAMDLTQDGKMAITCSDDHTVKLWNIGEGKLYKSIENVGDQPVYIKFCCEDRRAVVLDSKHLYVINLETSNIRVIDDPSLEISGDKVHRFLVFRDQSMLAVPINQCIFFLGLPSGKLEFKIEDHLLVNDRFGFGDILDGHRNVIAITSTGLDVRYEVHIADVVKKKVTHAVKVFEKPEGEEEDEFTVDALVMTKDESTVIASDMLKNNLYFINVAIGEIIRKLEGNEKDSVDLFHISEDNRYLYFCNIDHLCMWDLASGERTYTLHHTTRAQDIQTRDQKTYVSISGDHVCIWDITRSNAIEPNRNSGAFKVKEMHVLPQTDRYIVVVKTSTESDLKMLVIYDVLQEKPIRTMKVHQSVTVKCITDDEKIVLEKERKIIVLNPRNNKYVVCQGMLPKYPTEIYPLKRKSWIITLSRGRRKLKVYNWMTGRVEFLIAAEFRLESFTIDPMGRFAAAKGNEGPVLVFNIDRRNLMHKIFLREEIYIINELAISDNGQHLCVEVSREPEDEYTSSVINYVMLYDVQTGRMLHHLADWEALKVVEDEHSDTDLDITSYKLLKNHVLTCHYDHHMRFWDIRTGKKIDDILLPEGEVAVDGLRISPDGSRLVTCCTKSHMIVWDTHSRQRVASLTADRPSLFKPMVSLGDSSLIIIYSEVHDRLTQIRLVGGGSKPKRDQRRLKETYSTNTKLDREVIEMNLPDEKDEEDPDTDTDELSEYGSDSEADYGDDVSLCSSITPAVSQAAVCLMNNRSCCKPTNKTTQI